MSEKFDAIILGTGQAGPSLAARLTEERTRTTIEKAMHIHPTVTELIPTMLGALKPLE